MASTIPALVTQDVVEVIFAAPLGRANEARVTQSVVEVITPYVTSGAAPAAAAVSQDVVEVVFAAPSGRANEARVTQQVVEVVMVPAGVGPPTSDSSFGYAV